MKSLQAWQMARPGEPMRLETVAAPSLSPDEALVRVSGCGVCHTDIGFFYEGVRTVKEAPLTLGHEISGIVEDAGENVREWVDQPVIVPAVLPCGDCELCRKGRGRICRRQRMPGNHIDGGFASHVVVPARYLCPVEVADETRPFARSGVSLRELSVIADAVSTPYQAIKNAGLARGDVAVFVGAGGIGGFGVQVAKALGAGVVAIDVDERRLDTVSRFGADLTFNPKEHDARAIRKAIQGFAREHSLAPLEWKIFECSGSPDGQRLAFGLLTHGATLCVVGFTMDSVQLRLSNLMAFDARAVGNWGCDPEHYPDALMLVENGQVQLEPFVKTFPMSRINEVFEQLHHRKLDRRPVLVPDFD